MTEALIIDDNRSTADALAADARSAESAGPSCIRFQRCSGAPGQLSLPA